MPDIMHIYTFSLLLCVKICPFTIIYNAVGCGRPFPPVNGIIEPYSSTQEGAEIQYHCEEGHTPREWKTSQCQENGMWAPDPLLICTIGIFHTKCLKNNKIHCK